MSERNDNGRGGVMKVVVIGGVAAGMSAASKIKREKPDWHIIVFEMGVETSYGACGLPYYISGVNKDEDLLRIRTPSEFIKSGIDVRLSSEVTKVDDVNKVVTVINDANTYDEEYDYLIIASGASPIIPPIKNIDTKFSNVFSVKTIEDANKIKTYIEEEKVTKATIIGSGYIGLEMVEALLELGIEVTLFEMNDAVLASVDKEIATIISEELIKQHVSLHVSEYVVEVKGDKTVDTIVSNKDIYNTELLIVAAGVKPTTNFLEGSNILRARNGGIITNKKMETSVKGVYAGGDCTLIHHKLLNKDVYLPLGTHANKQGKLIGENIVGENRSFQGALGTAALKVCNLDVARTGLSEGEAKDNNIEYSSVFITAPSHAPYYPNQTPIYIKMLYDTTDGRILGAQLAGRQGVALRIDIIATIIDAGYTAQQVSDLDLCYAPPFSSVWDAVQIATNVIVSKRKKEEKK